MRIAVGETVAATLPPPVAIDGSFARYQRRWSREGDALVATTALELREHVLPAEQYAAVRPFFAEMRSAEAQPVVVHADAVVASRR